MRVSYGLSELTQFGGGRTTSKGLGSGLDTLRPALEVTQSLLLAKVFLMADGHRYYLGIP